MLLYKNATNGNIKQFLIVILNYSFSIAWIQAAYSAAILLKVFMLSLELT